MSSMHGSKGKVKEPGADAIASTLFAVVMMQVRISQCTQPPQPAALPSVVVQQIVQAVVCQVPADDSSKDWQGHLLQGCTSCSSPMCSHNA